MNIRSFGWRDLPLLHSYRDRGLFLDSTRVLIHGEVLIPAGAFFTFLGPTTRIFTYRCENDSHSGLPLIGQVTYALGTTYGRLSFLAPEKGMEMPELAALSDYIAMEMGRRGLFHILADVDESNSVYTLLRRSGFAIYARQRIWRLDSAPTGEKEGVTWRTSKPVDVIGARSLYSLVVPGLVQQVEPLPKRNLNGIVHYQNGELRAYIELKYGHNGIWVQPFVHPDVQNFDRQLGHMLLNLPGRRGRPLFICVRAYQSWLEASIQAMGGTPGPQQAVMVRHLTVARMLKQPYSLPAINGSRAEPTAPITRMKKKQFSDLSEVEPPPRSNSVI